MSLITRCPACGTTFKVVADQLKVSQGWVRCGHCSDVFDASLHLQPTPAPTLSDGPPAQALAEAIESPPSSLTDSAAVHPAVKPSTQGGLPDFDPAEWKKQQQTPALNESGSLRLNAEGQGLPAEPVNPASDDAVSGTAKQTADLADAADVADTPPIVSFVREAQRKAFWRKPVVRLMLGFACVLLSSLLAIQVLMQHRDKVASLQPGLTPLLQSLCRTWQCEVGPLRHIEAVVIESSSFKKLNADSYRLSFLIKNTSAVPVAMPSLEVTLTDPQEQAVLRRVLSPVELGAPSARLVAGTDFAGLVVMQVSGGNDFSAAAAPASAAPTPAAGAGPFRVAGYRVLAFYP